MADLHHKHCVPCEGSTPPLGKEDIAKLHKDIKGWTIVDNKKLEKKFIFIDFKHAVTFINEVADVAEFEGHHPDMNLHNWNNVTISLSTHAIKGLSENDFIMAAKIDQIIADTLPD